MESIEIDKIIEEQKNNNTKYKEDLNKKIKLIEIMIENKHIKECDKICNTIIWSPDGKLLDNIDMKELKNIMNENVLAIYKYKKLRDHMSNNINQDIKVDNIIEQDRIIKLAPPIGYKFKLTDIYCLNNEYYLEDDKYILALDDVDDRHKLASLYNYTDRTKTPSLHISTTRNECYYVNYTIRFNNKQSGISPYMSYIYKYIKDLNLH